jgi:hypothetical protein
MFSQEVSDNNDSLPDLIVNQCIFGCEGCPGVWTNKQINHRIICRCICGHGRIKNNEHKKAGLQGSRIGTLTSQAACAPKPTTPVRATHVNVGLMESNDSTGRDHTSEAGGNLDANEE